MTSNLTIERAKEHDAAAITAMLGALLAEIMTATGVPAFHFDPVKTTERCADFLRHEKYFVFVARADHKPVGFVALYESHALYAEGAFGTIPELYVRPEYRSRDLGHSLIAQAKAFGASRGWSRLEVTTPALPEFDRTLAFYEREGFSITGGHKLALALWVLESARQEGEMN
jgi:GNAT superfamily N-acetyltransferase